MNFVPTTQKVSLRTGGYSQFAPLTLIWKFNFNVLISILFGLLDCGDEPMMSKLKEII